uniref:Anaphase-promoting complex subunit CDC26 n=1 Tax=Neogobius melanostomus TaxID=47308 RepID=A0A8C6S2D1_9GOBI
MLMLKHFMNNSWFVAEMLRRKPTRIELKIDDCEEFESIKKELEARKRQREEAESGAIGDIIAGGGATASASTTTRAELINERIGFKPLPKPNTLPGLSHRCSSEEARPGFNK